jgi:hypothetical protein
MIANSAENGLLLCSQIKIDIINIFINVKADLSGDCYEARSRIRRSNDAEVEVVRKVNIFNIIANF